MRAAVYRNLDRPFQILGFKPLELTVLCCVFVGGGEIAQDLSLSRLWVALLTAFLAFSLFAFRRALGDRFARRLFRFLRLPTRLTARLIATTPQRRK